MTPEELVPYLTSQLEKPYLLGAKWDVNNPLPTGPIDCSGFVRWAYARAGIMAPDGSFNQFKASDPATKVVPVKCVGFFRRPEGTIHHVGILLDEKNVIEARGAPYNKVILRPRAAWEAWREFSGWRILKAVAEVWGT